MTTFISDLSKKVNLKVLVKCLIFFIITVILIFILYNPWKNNDSLRIVLLTVVSTIMSLVLAFALWEFVGKTSFAENVIALAAISKNIAESGLDYIYEDFKATNWKELIDNCKNEFVVAFTYGRTWREYNRETLESYIQRGGKMEFYLPDFRNDELMNVLDVRFKYEKGKTKTYIQESITELKTMGAAVFLYNGIFQASYYILDDIALLSVYNHNQKKGYVPAFRISREGSLRQYVNSEIEAIRSSSVEYSTD